MVGKQVKSAESAVQILVEGWSLKPGLHSEQLDALEHITQLGFKLAHGLFFLQDVLESSFTNPGSHSSQVLAEHARQYGMATLQAVSPEHKPFSTEVE
jgi:hypothetical protein